MVHEFAKACPGFGSRQRTEPLPIFLVLSEQHELKRKAISSRPSP